MGIKNLLKFLNNNYPELIKTLEKPINNNFNKTKIAIDISIILYQVIIAIRNSGTDMLNSQGEVISHILGLFNKTIVLLKLNILPIYVFDGKPPEFKSKILQTRRDIKYKAYSKLEEDLSEEEKIKYFKRTVSISKKQIEECKELLTLLGIPFIEAPEEADSQCAQLVKDGIASGVLTEDMDILTFGASTIYRNLTSYKKDPLQINLFDILHKLDLTYEQFVELCILFGCDYCDKIKDLSPDTIYKYYYKNKNIEATLNMLSKNNLITSATSENYNLINFYQYKNYFINPPNIDCNNIKFNKCNIKELEKLLVDKYGLAKNKIQNKLYYLDKIIYL